MCCPGFAIAPGPGHRGGSSGCDAKLCSLAGSFQQCLIAGPGAFVVTANGFADYPEQIRRKLQREITRQVTSAAN